MKITVLDSQNVLIATKVKSEASPFHIEKSVGLGEFHIAHYGGRGPKGSPDNQPLYVHANSKLTGKDEGPLKVGVTRGSNFVLGNVIKAKDPPSLSEWESEACFIRCAPRKAQHKSYLALDEGVDYVTCVPERKSQNKDKGWMLFVLERLRKEESSRLTVYRAPVKAGVARVELNYEEESEDEGEFDFEYEFEQTAEPYSDSDEN